jgi:serine/threonine-protein kinase/endoribonuclease IRE1
MSLGRGAMGTSVYVGIMEDGSEVAVKRMLIQSCKNFAENEKKIFSLIETNKSPFIVSYRSFFKDSTFMYLILDLCEETLEDYVESQLSIEHFRKHGPRMIKEILRGLDVLHDQGILHRDLKPSNILVDVEGHMRLADFGISRVFNEDESTIQTKVRGTRKWMPTEVIKSINEEIEGRYKRKSDVQTAGMIAFFILSKGKHPFGTHMYDCMANIAEGNPVNLDILEDLEARHFVSWLIRHNINDRPYACDALEHRFMVQVSIYEELLKQALKTDG